ncbi:alpha/beta hydrolase [Clostridium ganghwense]|uniref:Alpha/beta hydrolase n=1 Tax=Clostridium ganghwense TaxID=312089 RepID=A0ABT4CP29_9CLOT|nr:alpha/beta hydrolase [Clostridium ganghwense]MCY6369986.1 alpha/beta hydrolase [Clostridium ganghwense]
MVWSIIIIIFLIIIIIGIYFSNLIIYPKKISYEEMYDREIQRGKIIEKDFNKLEKEEVYIDSLHGYKLQGLFFSVKDSKKFIIICHGFTCSLYSSIKYMNLFLKRDFNVLIYNHRYHGLSGGKNTSFGYYEKDDLKAWTDWIFQRFGEKCKVGLHGESMGGGIVLENVAIDPRIKFCIADCAYSDMNVLMKHQLKLKYKLEKIPLLLNLVSFIIKIRAGWRFTEVSPIKALENVETPILFIHGENDDFVPTSMSKEMYSVKKGIKDIYIAPNAAHAQAYWKNKEQYDEKVGEFLEKINM